MSNQLLALALTAILVASSIASGQAPDDSVPRSVVTSIMRFHQGPGAVRFVVGNRLPANVASRAALPPGSRVIATLIGDDTVVIATVRGNEDSLRLWFAEEFELRGYEPGSSLRAQKAAFRPSERTPSNSGYCGAGQHFTVSVWTLRADSLEFALRMSPTVKCDPRDEWFTGGIAVGIGLDSPGLPTLFHPRSAEMKEICEQAARSRGDRSRTEATVATTAPARELLAHYGHRLDSLGWQRESVPGVLGTWTRSDSTGREMRLVLAIEPSPGGPECRTLTMTSTYIHP